MQKTKEEQKREIDALFADIDSEFGKKKKKASPPKVVRPNIMAELMSQDSVWKPVAVVSHIVTQTCRCCQGTNEYIGNVLIRHKHQQNESVRDYTIPIDESHSFLPRVIANFDIMVEECPSCTRLNFYQVSVEPTANQLSLFH